MDGLAHLIRREESEIEFGSQRDTSNADIHDKEKEKFQ